MKISCQWNNGLHIEPIADICHKNTLNKYWLQHCSSKVNLWQPMFVEDNNLLVLKVSSLGTLKAAYYNNWIMLSALQCNQISNFPFQRLLHKINDYCYHSVDVFTYSLAQTHFCLMSTIQVFLIKTASFIHCLGSDWSRYWKWAQLSHWKWALLSSNWSTTSSSWCSASSSWCSTSPAFGLSTRKGSHRRPVQNLRQNLLSSKDNSAVSLSELLYFCRKCFA